MNIWLKSLVMSLFLTLTFIGCGGGGSDNNGDNLNTKIDAYEKNLKKLLRSKIESAKDKNSSLESVINENIKQAAKKFASEDLDDNDIAASLTGIDILSSKFDITKLKIVKVAKNIEFQDSLNAFYYTVGNPITGNDQLLAYDLNSKKAFVVNSNVILKRDVFIYGGEKKGDKIEYTKREYGLYLDPTLEKETRKAVGRYGSFVYDFFKDNALMKFNPKKPSERSYVFKSQDIPQPLKDMGILVLSDDFKVFKNIVDTKNSYVTLRGFDSLADLTKGESEDTKKQTNMIVRLGDSAVAQGKVVSLVKNISGNTDYILANTSDVYTLQNGEKPNYKLVTYDKDLQLSTFVTDGEFFYATQNDNFIYLTKEGSDKIWAFDKAQRTLNEVNGAKLAGVFKYGIHVKAAAHGSNSSLIDGATTLSGINNNLSDGENAYFSFNYDLTPEVGKAYMFGTFGAYKNSQVFKLNGTNGVKIFDNGDGADDPLNKNNTEPINGHINLVATKNSKIFVEIGWYDNTDNCTKTITPRYPPGSKPVQSCIAVKYGTLDTAQANATDLTPLIFNDKDIKVTELPYYIARRVAPVAVNDQVFISTFMGGSKKTGYKYNQYTFDFTSNETNVEKNGRTYFTKSAKRENGIYDGEVILWDQITQTIKNNNGDTIADTTSINGTPGFSISAFTNGVPLAGIGTIGMLKNNKLGGNHAFELFLVDIKNRKLHYIELAPFSSWIYE